MAKKKKSGKNQEQPEQDILQEAGLPANWGIADVPVLNPTEPRPGAAPPSPNDMPPHFVGVLNPDMQHDKVFVGTQIYPPQIASTPLMPSAPSGNPQTNAAIRSMIKINQVAASAAVSGMVFRGTWQSFISYNINDVVLFNSSAYVAITGSVNLQPDLNSTNWTLLSENFVFNATITPFEVGGFGPFDTSTSATGNSLTVMISGTASATNEIALLTVCASNGATVSTPPGWSVFYQTSASEVIFYKILSSAQNINVNASLSVSAPWAATLAFFKFGGFATATITSIAIDGSDHVTVTCANTLKAGNLVDLAGLTNATFLNGAQLAVATASPTQFTASFTHVSYGPTADTGTATRLIMQITATSSGAGASPESKTLSSATTAESILAFIFYANQTSGSTFPFTSVSDTDLDSYSLVTASIGSPGGIVDGATANAAFSNQVVGGTTPTLTEHHTGTPNNAAWFAMELPGSASQSSPYLPYDVEEFRGSFFVCLKETTKDAFIDPTSWGQIAQGTGSLVFLSADYLTAANDYGRLIINTDTVSHTVTLPLVPPSNSWWVAIQGLNASVTINPNGNLLNGSTSNESLGTNQGVIVWTDGASYYTLHGVNSLTVPNIFTITGPDSSGNVIIDLATEAANTGFYGPTSGSPAKPTFRSAVPADLPPLGIVAVSSIGNTTTQSGNLRPNGAVPVAGLYRVSIYAVLIANPSAGSLTPSITWNDGTASRTATGTAIDTSATNFGTDEQIIETDGIHDISYALTLV